MISARMSAWSARRQKAGVEGGGASSPEACARLLGGGGVRPAALSAPVTQPASTPEADAGALDGRASRPA